jgi:glycosyltransferase involved in cell wall biosynthesis
LPEPGANVTYINIAAGDKPWGRIFWVQAMLPYLVKRIKAHALLSLSNQSTIGPRVPTIVLFHQPKIIKSLSWHSGSLREFCRLAVLRGLFFAGALGSSKVLVQTESVTSALTRKFPSLRNLVRTIPSGVSERPPSGVVRTEIRAQIERSSGPRILYVANAHHQKNHFRLIEAFAKLRRKLPDCSLLLTLPGRDGQQFHGPTGLRYLEKIHESARACGVESSIEWLGPLASIEVYHALQNADLMVFPSLLETFGIPLVEAMLNGCPIAAADRPYAHDVAGDAAAYFNPENTDEMCWVLHDLLTAPDRLESLRQAGLKRKEKFLYRNICPQIIDVFEECATVTRAPS